MAFPQLSTRNRERPLVQFGASWANTMRAISAPTILSIIGQICARYAARIAAAPKHFDLSLAAVMMQKTD